MGKLSMPMVISKTSNVDRFATISFFEAIRLLAKGDNVHATRMFAQAAKEERSDSMEAVAGSALQQSGLSSQMINMLLLALGSVGALALLTGLIVLVRRSVAKRTAQPKGEADPEGGNRAIRLKSGRQTKLPVLLVRKKRKATATKIERFIRVYLRQKWLPAKNTKLKREGKRRA